MLDSGIHKKLTSLIGGGGGSGSKTNVSWSIDGHCVNLSSVPTEIVRKTYPIKLMEVN